MIEIQGNIFDIEVDAVCITTNGNLKSSGANVMGKGIALDFKKKFPGIDFILGEKIKENGNKVYLINDGKTSIKNIVPKWKIFSFPTKHNWWEKSDMELIIKSAKELVEISNLYANETICLPKPGCSNGGLKWPDVKEELEKILCDDKFLVIDL